MQWNCAMLHAQKTYLNHISPNCLLSFPVADAYQPHTYSDAKANLQKTCFRQQAGIVKTILRVGYTNSFKSKRLPLVKYVTALQYKVMKGKRQ